jgi:hypothetical protein
MGSTHRLTVLFLPFLLFLSFFIISCSQASPVIKSHSVQYLRVQQDGGGFGERLAVFVFSEDSDGPEDLSALIVTHVDSGLSWEVGPSDLMVRLRGKDRWVGSNRIAPPLGYSLPEGSFRLIIRDLAGNEALRDINLHRPTFPENAPVQLSLTSDRWTLSRNPGNGGFTRTWILLFSGSGEILYSWRVPETPQGITEGTVQSLRDKSPEAVRFQVYTENSDGSAGVLLIPRDME